MLAISFVVLLRGLARAVSRRHTARIQRTVVVGAGNVGQLVAEKFRHHPEYGIEIVGFADDEALPLAQDLAGLPILSTNELPEALNSLGVDRVLVAYSSASLDKVVSIVEDLSARGFRVDIVPRLFDAMGIGAYVHTVEGLPLVGLRPMRSSNLRLAIKRMVDVAVSALVLLFLSPLVLAVAVLIRMDSPGSVFYRHGRVGVGGRHFGLLKFRTMRREDCRGVDYGGDEAEYRFEQLMRDPTNREEYEQTFKLTDDPRVTRFGAFLRKYSLDELPQLVNVLTGDLSLVGPRPVTKAELDRYGEKVGILLSARPGITGYWQINGRSEVSYPERVRMDIAYVSGWSLRLDLVIMAKTVRVVLARVGAF